MLKDYTSKVIKLYKNGEKVGKNFQFETFRESKRLDSIKIYLLKNIDKIIEDNWGKFSKEFIIHHILKAQILNLVRNNEKIIAFSSASYKRINNLPILYLEFTVVNEAFQSFNLSTKLNGSIISKEIVFGLLRRRFKPLNVITITRNPRVIGALSRFAHKMYPDPQKFQNEGKLKKADDITWSIVQEILKQSWNPDRKLERDGCVLVGSYQNTPWLIEKKVQRHYKNNIKDMCNVYLRFNEIADREFIVRVTYNLNSFLKYLIWKLKVNI